MKKIAKYKSIVNTKRKIRVNHLNLTQKSLQSWSIPEYYEDEEVVCKGCYKKFNFSALQKRYMYEVLKLYIHTTRQLCVQCRLRSRLNEAEILRIENKLKPKGYKQNI